MESVDLTVRYGDGGEPGRRAVRTRVVKGRAGLLLIISRTG